MSLAVLSHSLITSKQPHFRWPFQVGASQPKTWLSSLLVLLGVFGFGLAKAPTSFTVTATAYTSLSSQTDGSPFITATGARTRLGIIAVSRDLLGTLPYGSRVKLQDLSGETRFNRLFSDRVFVVEDTMHIRWRNKIDVWFPDNATAVRFGVRKLKLTVLQVGRG
ncbi:hypothetical protein Mgrana_03208 [Meiothermus granaticius NBRC 107808]|uniref:3D domain protein n=1 Tax=Meiothermus granaticius NBRC 107808 TaxID=1227551 RepID=A0A399F5T3_9DEIN|nr:hypothetical protein Mgrana_03208 [Meiothermus granaticius NBRC 107808]